MKNHPSPSVFEPIGKPGLRGPLKAFACLHVGRRWEDFTFDERRELLDLLRDNLQSLLPLLWEVYDKKPLADWGERMAGALALLNDWEDFGFESVPFVLKDIDLTFEDITAFSERAADLSASARREWVRRLVGGIQHLAGVAAGEWASLLELELLSLQAKRAELSAKAEVANAKADAAAARGDLDAERALRAEAQAHARDADALASELRQSRDGLQKDLEDRNRRSKDAKKKARNLPGPCGMPRALWERFRVTLDKALAEDKAKKPPLQKLGQLGVVEALVERHNENATHKIHASTDKDFATILKGWQRWRDKRHKAR